MASPDVPVDRVAMQYCMSAAGKDGQYRMHEGEKKEEMNSVFQPLFSVEL